MSAFGMKPHFTDYQGYSQWRSEWKDLYKSMSSEILASKNEIKRMERLLAKSGWTSALYWNGEATVEQKAIYDRLRALRTEHPHKQVMATKLMTLLNEAKIRWGNIKSMKKGIAEQMASFPLEISETRNIDFHFNKKSLEFDFIPMWTLKAKGKTYYVHHVDCNTAWTTRETPDNPTTKGAIRIKKGSVLIDAEGLATIS